MKKMKKEDWVNILCAVFGFMFGFSFCMVASFISLEQESNIYPTTMVVVEATDEYMIFENGNGFRYFVEQPMEDMVVGDFVSVIMEKNGTKEVYDDVVVQWRYSGFCTNNIVD